MTDPVDQEKEVQKRTTHLWVTSYAEPMELQSFAGVTSPCDIVRFYVVAAPESVVVAMLRYDPVMLCWQVYALQHSSQASLWMALFDSRRLRGPVIRTQTASWVCSAS